MSFTFSIGYRTPISSLSLNEKFHEVWGRNGVLKGLQISKHSNTEVKISSGTGVVKGVKVEYTEDNAGNPLRVVIPLDTDGKKYIYGLYNHKLASFTLHTTDGKYDAQGEWKLFLGHAEVVKGALLNVQPIVEPSVSDIDSIYKRMPDMNEVINFFYESTNNMIEQIETITNKVIGDLNNLKTDNKDSVVGSINELFDTKEPTLTRDRVLELLGGGENGGNIDIGSINGIPMDNFVLKNRAINTPANSGLKGGGDLSTNRSLSIDWGRKENQVPRGNHDHIGTHLDKKFSSEFGENSSAAVYSQLAYFAHNGTSNGTMKITLPKTFTDANLSIEINGFDAGVKSSSYTLKLRGVTSRTNSSWSKCTADILGKAPFKEIKFCKDGQGKPCILLGGTDIEWRDPSLFIKNILVSGADTSNWDTGWSIELMNSVTGVAVQQTPSITTGGPQPGEFVPPARAVNAGVGLIGGGSLNGAVTLSANFGTGSNNVARGNHTHSAYLEKTGYDGGRVLITTSNGSVTTTNTVTTDELSRLVGINGNIQSQLDNKSNNGHGHSQYLPLSGGTMTGALTFGDNSNHKISTHYLYLGGHRLTIGSWEPSVKSKGTVWIDLPF